MSNIRLSRDLAAVGFSPGDLARMTRAGDLVHLRRGAYAEPASRALDPRVAHLQPLEATVPHAMCAGGCGQEGSRVTGLAGTVVDLGCCLTPTQTVAAGDLALTRIDRAEITEVLDRQAGRTGIGKARRAVALLDPRSESAGESVSRVIFYLARLPAPEPQFSVFAPDGRFVGRSDFGWPDFGVLGEFDGKAKYRELLRKPGQSAEDVVIAEKQREDRMRELGWVVIRWMWQDLIRPEPLIGRLRQALHADARCPETDLHRFLRFAPLATGADRR